MAHSSSPTPSSPLIDLSAFDPYRHHVTAARPPAANRNPPLAVRAGRVAVRALIEFLLAPRAAEVKRLRAVLRPVPGMLCPHFHPAYRIPSTTAFPELQPARFLFLGPHASSVRRIRHLRN